MRLPRKCLGCTVCSSASTGSPCLITTSKRAGPARAANVKSVSKSIISALVGIAIDRRILEGVKQPIGRFFPELTKDPDPRKARITVEDLLTMRSGLESTSFDNYGTWVRSRNWVTYVLNQPLVSEPGTTMEDSTGSTHLLSAMLTRATKRSTWAFLQESLGKPLGLTVSRWPRDPQGIYFGGNDMLMTPRQMVAFGQLYLNRGRDRRSADRAGPMGRRFMHAARPFPVQSGSDLRVRLVDPRLCRAARLFRMGLRRAVHHAFSRSQSGRGHHVVHRGQRRTPRSSPADLRARRAPHPRPPDRQRSLERLICSGGGPLLVTTNLRRERKRAPRARRRQVKKRLLMLFRQLALRAGRKAGPAGSAATQPFSAVSAPLCLLCVRSSSPRVVAHGTEPRGPERPDSTPSPLIGSHSTAATGV